MIPNPILKVLSTFEKKGVRFLLMRGQACVLYGAAEFSRDMDVTVLASPDNLDRLRTALDELQAQVIAIPPFAADYLERGHAVHFRCAASGTDGIRVDVMSRMRGVAPFETLWERRTTMALGGKVEVALLSLPDLVAAKKTQRDKDWPMIRRLVEANYAAFHDDPTPARIRFWLDELRTPELLVEVAARFPDDAAHAASRREAIAHARSGDLPAIDEALEAEMAREREADRAYWTPLRKELEELRRDRPRA